MVPFETVASAAGPAVPVALAAAALALRRLGRPDGPPLAALRSRFVLGVPWGSLVVAALLVAVYVGLQRGATGDPLVVPFVSWSYFHPVGVAVAPFGHTGLGHLLENLAGVLVLGSLAEYAVGHYPDGTAGPGPLADPRVRAAVGFPLAAVLVALLASVCAWGPTIGASGLVYAFAGLAVVRYPLATVVGLAARDAVRTVAVAALEPVRTTSGTVAAGQPWWVDVAVATHVFGFLLGVAVGTVVVDRRGGSVDPRRTALGVGLLALGGAFWAVWWPTTDGFALYRGAGVALVLVGAVGVTAAVRAVVDGVPGVDAATARRAGFAALLAPLVVAAAVAVPVNATHDVRVPDGSERVAVRGYAVAYAEDVPDGRFGAVGTRSVRPGGVVVVNPAIGAWANPVPKGYLARHGTATVRLGGVGWSRRVVAVREGWRVTGADHVYRVTLAPGRHRGQPRQVFASDPASAAPVVAGRRVTLAPADGGFRVRVSRGGTLLGTAPVPARGVTVSVGGLGVSREGRRLVAVANDTRVPVAWAERP